MIRLLFVQLLDFLREMWNLDPSFCDLAETLAFFSTSLSARYPPVRAFLP